MNLTIGGHTINDNNKAFIIAELSANHNQDFDLAVKTIEEMKESGADAVKLQTYTPDSMTLDSEKACFQTRKESLWAGQKMYDLYKKTYTPWEWHVKLKKIANDLGLVFFSTPFDIHAVNKLESIDVVAYKIASFEITDIPLIERVAKTGKPIIISTGIANLNDIELAVDTCIKAGNMQFALLKCTSSYPTPLEEVNLNVIPNMKEIFGCIVGISDHTIGITVPIASVVLGAKIIEKHFILNKKINSMDKEFSLDPKEFKQMVDSIREVEKALGKISYRLSEKVMNIKKNARSLFAVENIKSGEILTEYNVRSIRPGCGLHPKYYHEIIGKKASMDIVKGTPLSWSLIS